jgi:hypothetical protein
VREFNYTASFAEAAYSAAEGVVQVINRLKRSGRDLFQYIVAMSESRNIRTREDARY